ncbi:MAG TPA: amino acid ABC transporter substrate-binding protein [Candidatus Dormibacteraeota bacterium]|nr:amino acid ABC transporter substrate-binding protein [Candidatus Dormibacteraeota bacterium]
MERRKRLIILSCATLALVGCSMGSNAPAPAYGDDIVVGLPLAASGNLTQEGTMARQGYDLWLDWVNGTRGGIEVGGVRHRVRLDYQDDTSKPDVDTQLTEKMITDDKAQFILGPYGASNTAAAAAVADQHHVPLVSANGSARSIFSKGFRYVFGVQTPAEKNLQVVFDLAGTLNPRPTTVAMLAADDSFSVEVAKGALDYAASKGFRLVFNQQYPNGSTDLAGLVAQVKAANPDIVVNSGHLLEAVAVNKAARDLRFSAKLFAYSVGPTMPSFVQSLGKDADFVVTGSQWTAEAQYKPDYYLTETQYVAAYRKKFNTQDEPNYQVADATAAGLALERAIERANSLDPQRVRDALASLDLMTFFGRIKFDANGQNVYKPMMVEQIQSGRRQTVWPLEVSGASALYPAPTWASRIGTPDPTPPPAKLPATGVAPRR